MTDQERVQRSINVNSTENANTRKQYDRYAQHYIEWCQYFYNNQIVSEARLIAFLVQEVVRMPTQKRGRKSLAQFEKEKLQRAQRRALVADNPELIQTLDAIDPSECVKGITTVKQYVTSIVDLWEQQRQFENNLNDHPRTKAVKKFLERLTIANAHEKDKKFEDRGIDTDGYTIALSTFKEIANWFWTLPDQAEIHESRADFLASRALLARGQTTRGLRFSECSLVEIDTGNNILYHAVKFFTKKGKRTLMTGMLRHRNIELCPVSALAMHLLHRFHIQKEKRPEFIDRSLWYNRMILKGHGIQEKTKGKQRESIRKAYKAFDVNFSKMTHVGRARGEIDLANAGVSQSSIERMGVWGLDSLNGSYLSKALPIECLQVQLVECLHVLAGFSKDEKYFLHRNVIQPPQELQDEIFPWISELEKECEISIKKNGTEYSGLGLIKLLKFLRVVILQDAAIYLSQQNHLHLDVFKLPVFKSERFKMFARTLATGIEEAQIPRNELLENAVPAIKQSLDSIQQILMIGKYARENMSSSFEQQCLKLNNVTKQLEYIVGSQQSLYNMIRNTASTMLSEAPPLLPDHVVTTMQNNSVETNDTSISGSRGMNEQNVVNDGNIPIVKLGSHEVVRTVRDVWAEWKEPWDGHSSIQDLINQYGDSWRVKSDAEKKLFSRRKAIVKLIEKGLETKNLDDVIADLEVDRRGRALATWIDKERKRQRTDT